MPNYTAKIGLWRLHQQVVVIVHQTVGMDYCIKAMMGFIQRFQEGLVVLIIMKNILSPSSSVHYVVEGVFIFYSDWSWHGVSIVDIWIGLNEPDPCTVSSKNFTL